MSISDSSKLDLLYKKAFGVAKTDTAGNKGASNESIASPSLLRADIIWTQSSSIPATAAAVSNIVQSYNGTSKIECVADTTSSPINSVYPTWKTNLINWIPPEFGSTYFVKIYVDNTGASNPASTGIQIFDSGSGGTGEWYFDYKAGILNFIGGTIPAALTSSKVIYVMGYRYIGTTGLDGIGGGGGSLTLQQTDSSGTAVENYTGINTLQFDQDSGFDVTNPSTGVAKVAMNSTFKYWEVDGTQKLTAVGLDTVNFISGTGVAITADGNANPQSITISATGGSSSLPSQSGNEGKFLTTDGSTASWATVSGGGGGGSTKVVKTSVSLGTVSTGSAWVETVISSVAIRGLVSLFTVTPTPNTTYSLQVWSNTGGTGTKFLDVSYATGIYSITAPWYFESDVSSNMYIRISNNGSSSASFVLDSMRVEKFA